MIHRPMIERNTLIRNNPSRHPLTPFVLRQLRVPQVGALLGLLLLHPLVSAAESKAAPISPPAPKVESIGSLVIVGGGVLPDEVRDRFLKLAGGKKARLVVIPTASALADRTKVFKSYTYWQAQGLSSVALLHTLDHAKANDPVFVKPLTEATGAWLSGGDQSRLITAYHGTAVERELRRLLSRGGVIGGTSAGASAMGAVMITGGNPQAMVGTGFGLLPDVVIDQHFQNRNRLNRLLGVLTKYPRCLGLGIDEQTAVVVHGHTLTVLGNADVRVCLPPTGPEPASVQILKAGQAADLIALNQTVLRRIQSYAERKPPAPVERTHPMP